MTRKLNIKNTIAGVAATLALTLGLFAAPDAMAGDRGKRWNDGRGHYVERHVKRHRAHRQIERRRADRRGYRHAERRRADRRAYRFHRDHRRHVHRPAPRRHIHRHAPRRHYHRHHVKRRDFPVGAVIAGIGVGIITHAIISNHHYD